MKKRFIGVLSQFWLGRVGCLLMGIMAPLAMFAQGSPDIIWAQSNGNSDRINSVIFSNDGNTVISGGSDRLINFWSAANGSLQRTLDSSAAAIHNSSVEALALSPDGTTLASVNFQTVKLWRLSDGSLKTLSGHTDWVVGCAYSPNGAFLATASFDGTVKVWRGSDGAALKSFFHTNQMRSVAFSPDSRLMAYGGGDNTLYVRQTSDWSLLYQLTGHSDDITSIAFSPDGSVIATGSYDQTARVWDVSNGSQKFVIGNNKGNIYSVAFSPDGSTLAYTDGEGNTVRLVRTSDGFVTKIYTSNVDQVQTLAFSPSGLLAYGRVDRTVVLANVGTGGGGGTAPTVTIVTPATGKTFVSGSPITISANAAASAGIGHVEFLANGQSLAVLTAPPFTFQWTNATSGAYNISATVTDTLGATASESVSINVVDPAADKTRPAVSITAPTANAHFPSNSITLTGKSSDNIGVNQVLVSLNGGDFQAADGISPWSISLQLNPGPNTVQVKSVDTSGNESAIVTRSFTYVVTSALNVTVSGNGRVVPDLTKTPLQSAGKRLTLRAVPATGFIFNGWTGDITTNTATFTLTMAGVDMSVQANFVPNPFLPLAGTYQGLALAAPPAIESTGFGRFVVASSGGFSGRLYYNGTVFSLSGTFLGDGTFSKTLTRAGKESLDLELQLHMTDGTEQITGTVSNSVAVSTLTADLATFNAKTNPAPQAGRYTFILPANADGSGPQGTGYGTLAINSGGVVTLNGKLPDGTAISQSTALSKTGTWPFFQWLSSGNQVLAGQITVQDAATSDMDGTVNWFRNAMKTRFFPAGFTTQVGLVGSLYLPAVRGTPVLDFSTNAGNALVVFQGGNLDAETDLPATLTLRDQLTAFPSTNKNISASFARSTGLFSGSFLNPTTSRNTPFSGAILQKQNIGAGFFLGTDQSGSVRVEAAPATP